MKVRKMRKSDIFRCIPLFISSFSESPYKEEWSGGRARKRLVDLFLDAKDYCLVAEEKSVIAFLFSRKQTWDDGVHIFVEDLAVSSEFRRKGVASLLVKELERVAKLRKVASIDLAVNTHSAALNFWKKMGYARYGYVLMKKKI